MRVEDLRDEVVDGEVRAASSRRRSACASGARSRRSAARRDELDERGRPRRPRRARAAPARRACAGTGTRARAGRRPARAARCARASRARRGAGTRSGRRADAQPVRRAPAAGRSASARAAGRISIIAEVVRVAGERVRPVHALALDRAVDVDRARAAGQRDEHRLVEVAAAARARSCRTPYSALATMPPTNQPSACQKNRSRAPREVRDRRRRGRGSG